MHALTDVAFSGTGKARLTSSDTSIYGLTHRSISKEESGFFRSIRVLCWKYKLGGVTGRRTIEEISTNNRIRGAKL